MSTLGYIRSDVSYFEMIKELYIISTLIDWIRKKIIEPMWMNFVNT